MMHKALEDKTMCSLAVKLEPSTTLLEFNISRHASHQPPVLQQIILLKKGFKNFKKARFFKGI
jgi:hypothetical protein